MFSNLPPAVRAFLLANIGVFVLQLGIDPLLRTWFALWPPGYGFQPWQLITYAFLHDGPMHILLNMFALWMFGTPMARLWCTKRFTAFYFLCVLTAALTQLTVSVLDNSIAETIGASGAIYGLLLAFAVYFPRERIMLLFPPIPLPAWAFVTIYGAVELFSGIGGIESQIGHFAHLGGMLGAAAMILFWRLIEGPLRS